MKICIFGGRDFDDYDCLKDEFIHFVIAQTEIEGVNDIEIITGGARGADELGKTLSKKMNIKHKEFKADWNKHGKAAGPIRNREMANYCDVGLGFHDDKSRGTANMINTLRKMNKPVHVFHY